MKIFQLVMVSVLVLSILVACSDKTHETYTIARKGVLIQNEYFEVIHVYGFLDNLEIAREITDFLNESEPKTYNYYQTE